MFKTLLVLWTLSFTIPTHLTNGDTLTDFSRVRVYRQHQSPTWVAMHVAMEMDSTVWTHFWPMVKAEAEPVWVINFATSPGVLPDTLVFGYEYFVTAVRKSGAVSGPSNIVGR